MTKFTQEDVNVRLEVKLSFVLTLGLYSGPIDRTTIAQNLVDRICRDDDAYSEMALAIDSVRIMEVVLDDETKLVEAEG